MGTFDTLFKLDVNEHVEKKTAGGTSLSYLSWSWAWAEVKKRYPEAVYEVVRASNGLPYVYDENTGYMVFTKVTIDGITHEMWLPVMDGSNKSMKSEPYTYDTRYKKGLRVEAATMFDINKAIMRCLVKNLAMFGLGLYIYAGEDLPEGDQEEPPVPPVKKTAKKKEPAAEAIPAQAPAVLITPEQKAMLFAELNRTNVSKETICRAYGVKEVDDMDADQYAKCMKRLKITKTYQGGRNE